MTTTITKADLPEGYEVVKDEFEVPCDHVACDLMHRHLFNAHYADGPQTVEVYDMQGRSVGFQRNAMYHMATRRQWVILLNGTRVGDAHSTKRDAMAEAVRRPTI